MKQDDANTFLKLAPFDTTASDHLTMYDQLPYVRDPDECNGSSVAMNSGNVIKFYRCNVEGSYAVNNHDERTARQLDELRRRQAHHPKAEPVPKKQPEKAAITEEQVEELLREPLPEVPPTILNFEEEEWK